jgi:aldehyde dehydrogenase (NAD+)
MASGTQDEVKIFDRLFIGGSWVEPSSDATVEVISPLTEQVVARVAQAEEADIDAAVGAAHRAFYEGPWPNLSPAERGEYLMRLHDEVESRLEAMAAAFTLDAGAPAAISMWGQQLAMPILKDAATIHERVAFEEDREWDAERRARIVREPIGVVAAIIPWNGPVVASALKIAPALAAGCTVVLKPADEALTSVMLFAEAVEAAGFPAGVVSILPAGREMGEYLVTHPEVDKVAFTGSTAVGKRIGALCGERVRPVTLELGGKSAAIIADDMPLDEVLPGIVTAGIGHSGQVCAALTRILVPRERQDEVVAGLKAVVSQWKVGDPDDPETLIGPLTSERQRERVEEYIKIGQEEGASLVIGGGRPDGIDRGWFVEPTVFADVDNGMRIAQEEIFGPVLVVIPYDGVDDAVAIANDSPYGLSGAVFAADPELAEQIARRIRTGQIGVNEWDMCTVQPFGGYKQSGLGREGGPEGIMQYLETKVLMLAGS